MALRPLRSLNPANRSVDRLLLSLPNDNRGYLQLGDSALFFTYGHVCAAYDARTNEVWADTLMLDRTKAKQVHEFVYTIQRTNPAAFLVAVGRSNLEDLIASLLQREFFSGIR